MESRRAGPLTARGQLVRLLTQNAFPTDRWLACTPDFSLAFDLDE